ncbi:MAG: hypothetical protein OXH79_22685 [Boseongicola sp.]|nr:hypothetical protein [Boseongicola sp.]
MTIADCAKHACDRGGGSVSTESASTALSTGRAEAGTPPLAAIPNPPRALGWTWSIRRGVPDASRQAHLRPDLFAPAASRIGRSVTNRWR